MRIVSLSILEKLSLGYLKDLERRKNEGATFYEETQDGFLSQFYCKGMESLDQTFTKLPTEILNYTKINNAIENTIVFGDLSGLKALNIPIGKRGNKTSKHSKRKESSPAKLTFSNLIGSDLTNGFENFKRVNRAEVYQMEDLYRSIEFVINKKTQSINDFKFITLRRNLLSMLNVPIKKEPLQFNVIYWQNLIIIAYDWQSEPNDSMDNIINNESNADRNTLFLRLLQYSGFKFEELLTSNDNGMESSKRTNYITKNIKKEKENIQTTIRKAKEPTEVESDVDMDLSKLECADLMAKSISKCYSSENEDNKKNIIAEEEEKKIKEEHEDNETTAFYTLINHEVNDIPVHFTAEIDACKIPMKSGTSNYVELKTHNVLPSGDVKIKATSKLQKKLLSTYCQNKLIGCQDVVIGFRTSDFRLASIKSYDNNELSNIINNDPVFLTHTCALNGAKIFKWYKLLITWIENHNSKVTKDHSASEPLIYSLKFKRAEELIDSYLEFFPIEDKEAQVIFDQSVPLWFQEFTNKQRREMKS
ncbi:uncharacterized protein RJT20DRAFT_124196 [Scheffersomyces xylosifermentans]|uniref:uncharacterized protein n=1 Tax=Scheffersomyces xylosifermentans TaxID=1304137 RepID=UPI00315CEAFF